MWLLFLCAVYKYSNLLTYVDCFLERVKVNRHGKRTTRRLPLCLRGGAGQCCGHTVAKYNHSQRQQPIVGRRRPRLVTSGCTVKSRKRKRKWKSSSGCGCRRRRWRNADGRQQLDGDARNTRQETPVCLYAARAPRRSLALPMWAHLFVGGRRGHSSPSRHAPILQFTKL